MPRAATSVRMSDCWLPGATAACTTLVIVFAHADVRPNIFDPTMPEGPIVHPTAIQAGNSTATIAMMVTTPIENFCL